MAFHDPIDAIAWALDVQHRLLLLPWPAELLTQPDAKEQYSPPFMPIKRQLFKGLRVRMAMHTGKPEAIQVCACLFVCLSIYFFVECLIDLLCVYLFPSLLSCS